MERNLIRWLESKWFRWLGRRRMAEKPGLALAHFHRAAELDPNNLGTQVQVAWCLHKVGNHNAAIDQFELVLQKRPDYGAAHVYLALTLAEIHRTQHAVDEVRRGLRTLKKKQTRAFFETHLGQWLNELGRSEEAIEPLRNAIASQPHSASAHYQLGYAYARIERHDEAEKEFRESIRFNPAWASTYYSLGQSLVELKKFDDATIAYKEAIRLCPNDADARFSLAVVHGQLGRHDDEISEYKRGIETAPDDFQAWNNLAITYSQVGDHESAIAAWKTAIKLHSQDVKAYEGLGLEYHNLERFEEALNVAQEIERIRVAGYLTRLGKLDEGLTKHEALCNLIKTVPMRILSLAMP